MTIVTFTVLLGITGNAQVSASTQTNGRYHHKPRRKEKGAKSPVKVKKHHFPQSFRGGISKIDQETLANKKASQVGACSSAIKVKSVSVEKAYLSKREREARRKLFHQNKKVRQVRRSRFRDEKYKLLNRDMYDHLHYDLSGYDVNGYDRDGYDRNGYDASGFNSEGYDREGYDPNGFDEFGYDREGYDPDGFDCEGYNEFGRHQSDYASINDVSDTDLFDNTNDDESNAVSFQGRKVQWGEVNNDPIETHEEEKEPHLSDSVPLPSYRSLRNDLRSLQWQHEMDQDLEEQILRQRVRHRHLY